MTQVDELIQKVDISIKTISIRANKLRDEGIDYNRNLLKLTYKLSVSSIIYPFPPRNHQIISDNLEY